MDEQRIYRRKNEMLQRDLKDLTSQKMQTYEQFKQNQFRGVENESGFMVIEERKDKFYSMDRVEENTLMIDQLLNNANELQLSTAQREDLGIRRNRVKDFELLNNRTKEDSKEMRLLKEEIRNYDLLLSWTPHNIQECMQYCTMAQQKCEDAIERCNDYLRKGKSLRFWKSNRNERYDMVKEARERYLRDKQRFTDLLEKPDMEQLMRDGDTMLDLMNYEAIKERHQQEQERQRQAEEERQRQEDEKERVIDDEEDEKERVIDDEEDEKERVIDDEEDEKERVYDEEEDEKEKVEEKVEKQEEEQQRREEDRKAGEEQAEGVNEFFEGVEEQQRQAEEARQAEQQQQQHVHNVSYDLDEKNSGLETQTIAAGASMVTVIKDTKTKQKVYFRQGENAGGWNSEELVKNFMESIKGEIQLSDAMKENLKKAFGDLMPQQLLDRIKKAYMQQNEKELKGAIDQLDGFGMVGYRSSNFRRNIDSFVQSATCPGLLKDVYRNATDKVRTEIGKAFTLFARKQFQWSYSVGSAGIDPEQSLTDRSVATSKLAGLLGLGSMVSDSGTAVIKKDGKEITGNVTEDAGGKTIDRMKGTWSYSDKAIGQAYTLQVFDMICGQIDRHHENYRVIEKNQNVDSIKAVNNEMSFGKLTWEKIAAGHENISPLTESHVRAMPIAVINQILSLDEKALQEALGDVLDNDSMHYLLDRLAGVQKSIVEYAKKGKAGLQLSKDGKTAEFTGEDQDDTLRMLKAVKKGRDARTMIWWDNLTEKTLDEKIEMRKKELALKK